MRELLLPWPSPSLSPNARVHWSKRARAAADARALAMLAALASGWRPQSVSGDNGRLHLWWDFYSPTRRYPDDDNMLTRCKAYRDGIADALGIDDRRFVSHPYVQDEVRKGGEVRVRITGEPQTQFEEVR